MNKTFVTFLVDKSGSMSYHKAKVPQVFNDLTETLVSNAQGQDIQTRVSYFGHPTKFVTGIFSDTPPKIGSYAPYDKATALTDAIGKTIQQHQTMELGFVGPTVRGTTRALLNKPQPKANIAHLIVVVTDGEENSSREYSVDQIKAWVQSMDNLTLVLSVPSRGRIESYGTSPENIMRWDTDNDQALETQVSLATSQGLRSYTMARAAGATKVNNFYATTDLSHVTKADLNQCQDLTRRFKPFTVAKEQRIDEAVEDATGQPYVKGTAFYQLTKREEIQKHKDLLIMEKGKKTVYGGPQVRTLLGLPQYQDGKVTPGNHANFDIFVQSTSDNRKLVRGTKVLVVK